MNRPIFGFLWPKDPDKKDGQAQQRRLIRIPARGPLRLAGLIAATLALVMATGTLISAGLQHWTLLLMASAIVATFTVLVLRAWSVGTYVNDDGVVIQRMMRAEVAPWRDVQSVGVDPAGRVRVALWSGQSYGTHIAPHDVDLIGRDEAYRVAVARIERWFHRA